MTACDGYGYTVSVTAGAVHIHGTITGHWMARLCLGGKMLEHLTTVLLRDWWAKPRSKEQKWQVWVPSQTQKQASYPGTELDRSLKHIKGRSASWHIYISWDRKITLLKELMAQGYFLFASNSAHKTLALSNLKRPGPEMKISMTPLLEADEGTSPRPPSPEMMTTQQLLKTWPRGHSDNWKLFPHGSLYAGPLKLQGTACSLSSAACRASQLVCHTLPDTTEVLFSLLVWGREGSGKPWMQPQNLAVTWLGRTLSTMKVWPGRGLYRAKRIL